MWGRSVGSGGVFSSNRCCLAPLRSPAIEEDAEEAGAESREEASEEEEVEEVVDDTVEDKEEDEVVCTLRSEDREAAAAAAAAAARLSCMSECAVEIRAISTLGGSGREEGGVRWDDAPPPTVALPDAPTSRQSPNSSSSACLFRWRWAAAPPALEPGAGWLCSPPAVKRAGGSRESESSGFCSRWRRKCTLRLPRVVKRLRHTGHW